MDLMSISSLLGNIGEFIGAIAVVATLGYLVVQIRQNTAAITSQTYEGVMAGFNEVNTVVADNPGLAAVFLKGDKDPDSLDDAEAVQYAFLYRCWSNQWLKLLRLYESGTLSKADWSRMALEAAQAFQTAGGQRFREENHLFEELYQAIDKMEGPKISQIRLGGGNV